MTAPKWAMERAKDIRQEWMRIALTEDKELALPAGHLSLMASFIAAAHKEGWEAGKESACEFSNEIRARSEENSAVKPKGIKDVSQLQYLCGFLAGKRHAATEIEEYVRALPYPDPVEKAQE